MTQPDPPPSSPELAAPFFAPDSPAQQSDTPIAEKLPIRVAVLGASGNMGRACVVALLEHPQQFLLVGVHSRQLAGQALSAHCRVDAAANTSALFQHLRFESDIAALLTTTAPQVVVDFTHPKAVLDNAHAIIAAGAAPVIGATGLSPEALTALDGELREAKLGGLYAPNFAIGAVLMMQFAAQAAKHFEHMGIIERHHARKADAPSGTALQTAVGMAKAREDAGLGAVKGTLVEEHETIPGVRGGRSEGDIPIYSLRMPGVIAQQEVTFGALGETLSITHNTTDRRCFMAGVLLACERVTQHVGLTVGLEHYLFG